MFKPSAMTELEVVSMYRQAKNKTKQVAILAQLNACTSQDIIDVLIAHGIDRRSLPRNRSGNKTKSTEPNKAENTLETPPTPPPSPECTESLEETHEDTMEINIDNGGTDYESTIKYIQSLLAERDSLEEQLLEIEKKLHSISVLCGYECE